MMENSEDRILGIDYGEKRIGLAISDPLKLFASPLVTLDMKDNFWQELSKIIVEYHVTKIVLGYPLKESGEKSRSTELVEKFLEELKKRFSVPVELIDERYSSSIAMQQIIETVKSKKKRRDKSLIDKKAAAVILQDYLNGAV
ncbi:MAG: Holliday junction resolvase RuvX [bacterium]